MSLWDWFVVASAVAGVAGLIGIGMSVYAAAVFLDYFE